MIRLFDSLRAVAQTWRTGADSRDEVTPGDKAAEGMRYCAEQLEQHVALLEAEMHRLNTAEYAAIHGVSAQTVRNWCVQGELVGAELAGGEWRIPRNAKAPKFRSHRKPAA